MPDLDDVDDVRYDLFAILNPTEQRLTMLGGTMMKTAGRWSVSRAAADSSGALPPADQQWNGSSHPVVANRQNAENQPSYQQPGRGNGVLLFDAREPAKPQRQ